MRLKNDQLLDEVDDKIIMECAQLVKANSIEGCKLRELDVVYTSWANLQKTSDMEVGQIGYHDRSKVKKIRLVKDNAIVNRLNKTKIEKHLNLSELQQERMAQIRANQKATLKAAKIKSKTLEKQEIQSKAEKKELESFSYVLLLKFELSILNINFFINVSHSSLFIGAEMRSTAEVVASVDDR